jgi:hypothetical protein
MSWWIALILLISALLWFCLFNFFCSGPIQATVYWQKVYGANNDPYSAAEVYAMVEYNGHLYAALGGGKVEEYDGSSWTQINPDALENSSGMTAFNGSLYVGTYNETTGAEVWAWDGITWSQVNTDGFGPGLGAHSWLQSLVVYKNNLYAVVEGQDYERNFRVYRYDNDGTTNWTRVDNNAWGDGHNGLCATVFNDYLYIGTELVSSIPGAEVWRYDGVNWNQVNIDGFEVQDQQCACLSAYNGSLYCGTRATGQGGRGRVYRFNGGTSWTPVSSYGLGDAEDILSLCQFSGKLYAGTIHNLYLSNGGCQVWSYDGTSWTKENQNGFGDDHNVLAGSMTVFNDCLYVGTSNFESGAQIWRTTSTPQYQSAFYFAEGYTGPNFQEYLCLGNPNSSAATVEVTYMFNGGGTKDASYSVAANSRTTVDVNSAVGAGKEVSIRVRSQTANLVAERPMYFNYQGKWTGGSDAVGAVSPGKRWYFAEGTTRPEFEEWLTVQNPGSQTANLTFHYMVEGQGEAVYTGQVGPNSRATFKTSDQVGLGKDLSLMLESDQDVVAERPMYFSYQGLASHNWTGGHDVVGALSPAKEWYLAEGTTRDGFEEWLCLQNPNSFPITVNASYLLGPGQGGPVGKSYTVPAQQRLTVSVNKELGPEKDVSVKLTCDSDFLAERPMYFLYHGAWDGGHDVIGALAPAQTWFLAEGYTDPNFEEWLCLQNPGTTATDVTITYYPESGPPITKVWTVGANSRQTVNVNVDFGAGLSISAKVESKQPIIVERPMYFNFNGWTGGHDVVGFVPQ